jgi:hypothetical protein
LLFRFETTELSTSTGLSRATIALNVLLPRPLFPPGRFRVGSAVAQDGTAVTNRATSHDAVQLLQSLLVTVDLHAPSTVARALLPHSAL